MSLFDIFHKVVSHEPGETLIEGTIVEGPSCVSDGDGQTIHFRLDSKPDLEFRQILSPLAPDRRRGDHVRVHYRLDGPVADVEWVERL